MKRSNSFTATSVVAATVCLLSCGSALSDHKPGHNPGGGKGGGPVQYTLVPLPHQSGSMNEISYAEGLHELRDAAGALMGMEVVGISAGSAHYWALDASGNAIAAVELAPPDGADPETTLTDAKDINDDGVIVGSGDGIALAWLSFLDVPIALPLPAGFAGTAAAVNVNNHGLVVGWLSSATANSIVAWGLKIDGTHVGPLVLATDFDAWAPDVNDAGTVVGTIEDQAYCWQVDWDGTNLSTSAPEALWGGGFPLHVATGVNEHGDICGRYSPNGSQTYLLTAEGVLIDMPDLVDNGRHGTTNIGASDLNDAPTVDSIQVVGQANVYRKKGVPVIDRLAVEVLWQGEQTIDLEKKTNQPTSDLGIQWLGKVSDAGWLAGFGLTNDDIRDERAIVLVPN